MEIMDVTLRESVYYEAGIDYKSAIKYLEGLISFVDSTELQYVEIGYLNTNIVGHLNYNREYFLNASELLIRKGFKVVAMMHPGKADVKKWDSDVIKKINLVRIVCNGNDVPETVRDYITYLHERNVKVSVNIAYVLSKSKKTLLSMYNKVQEFGADYVYFADSSGSAITEDIDRLCKMLKKYQLKNSIGFHLHDHLNMAFSNAIRIMKNGIDITDVSITGAGKGGGNLKLENILPYLKMINNQEITADYLIKLICFIRFFNKLIKRENDVYEQSFLNLYIGLFKIPLRKQEEIETLANNDVFEYTRLIIQWVKGE